MIRSALRIVTLAVCAVMGLWALAHGIFLASTLTAASHEEMLHYLFEMSLSIAGGVCVLSVAVEQLICWRTHHKDGGLIRQVPATARVIVSLHDLVSGSAPMFLLSSVNWHPWLGVRHRSRLKRPMVPPIRR